MTQSPNPSWHPTRSHLTLKGVLDHRALINLEPQSGASFFWDQRGGHLAIDASIPFRGALEVVRVPAGSQWSISLSDQPILKAVPSQPLMLVAPTPGSKSPGAAAPPRWGLDGLARAASWLAAIVVAGAAHVLPR